MWRNDRTSERRGLTPPLADRFHFLAIALRASYSATVDVKATAANGTLHPCHTTYSPPTRQNAPGMFACPRSEPLRSRDEKELEELANGSSESAAHQLCGAEFT